VNGGLSSTDFTQVTSYDGSSRQHTLTVAVDLLTAGTIYKFKLRSSNVFGDSDYSEEIDAAIASFPLANEYLSKGSSTETSITLKWEASVDTELPVIGYVIKINDGVGGDYFTEVSTLYPNVRTYTVSCLMTGQTYGFTIEALNFNGASLASEPVYFTICTNPKLFAAAKMTGVTETTMTLTWLEPNVVGGCPILSYSIFVFESDTYSELDSESLNNLPALRSYTLNFDSSLTGQLIKFYMSVSNIMGSTESPEFEFTLAAVPS
jgi:hypothetical protein